MSRIIGFDLSATPKNHEKLLDSGTCDLRIHPYTSRGLGFPHQKFYSEGPNVWITGGWRSIYIYMYIHVHRHVHIHIYIYYVYFNLSV